MTQVSCRCGSQTKVFKKLSPDSIKFFIGECCLRAGFNDLGEKVEAAPPVEKTEELESFLSPTEEEATRKKRGRKPKDVE